MCQVDYKDATEVHFISSDDSSNHSSNIAIGIKNNMNIARTQPKTSAVMMPSRKRVQPQNKSKYVQCSIIITQVKIYC